MNTRSATVLEFRPRAQATAQPRPQASQPHQPNFMVSRSALADAHRLQSVYRLERRTFL